MANQIQNTKVRCYILFFLALSPLLCNTIVYGRTIATTKNIDLFKHKGTVKTIESDDGEIIDCVDIYQQPAFDHPALKNHTLQTEPSEIPSWIAEKSNQSKIFQGLFKTVECPEKTIPIIRTQKDAIPRRIRAISRLRNQSTDAVSRAQIGAHEYALVSVLGGPSRGQYIGASGRFNVWNPRVETGELSIAQMWIRSGFGDSLNTMEAGWIKFGTRDKVPRFFIFWTADGYRTTGCFNHNCAGFFQTSNKVVLGATFSPISKYNNNRIQQDITIIIEKNTKTGHWWLHLQNMAIGYWPDTIFTTLQGKSAERIDWGGEITNSKNNGHHTTTQMGSGHFSGEGFGRASYIRNIAFRDIDINGRFRAADPRELVPTVTSSSCYDLSIGNGNDVFYGGPGYSRTCP